MYCKHMYAHRDIPVYAWSSSGIHAVFLTCILYVCYSHVYNIHRHKYSHTIHPCACTDQTALRCPHTGWCLMPS